MKTYSIIRTVYWDNRGMFQTWYRELVDSGSCIYIQNRDLDSINLGIIGHFVTVNS